MNSLRLQSPGAVLDAGKQDFAMLPDARELNSETEVLVVDDDPESRAELAAAITETGLVCFVAPDADTAVRKTLSRPSVGVVVTDIQMPGNDGIALIRRLRDSCIAGRMPETIIVTGYPAYDVARDAVRLSAVDFLSKPVGRGDLLAAVTDASIRWNRRLADRQREGVEAKVRLLGEELSRLCMDLQETKTGDDRPPRVAEPDQEACVDAAAVKALIRARAKREKYFGPGFFSDPSWDMLLDLSAAALEEKKVTVSSLCNAARVPHATALRRIDDLVEAGLVVRRNDTEDRRRVFVELTPEAKQSMTQLLEEMLDAQSAARD